ncbi:MAG: hypothetical protein IKC97_01335 [Clostridia bacterium]|nr:hypothetical protein [Clostridia bacterium]
MRYRREQWKQKIRAFWHGCVAVMRGLCCAVVIAVLTVFVWRLGQGIDRVRDGEITPAQMLQDMGEWLSGKENKTEGGD